MTGAGVDGCLACDLATGRMPLPGGVIYATERWLVEHCVGPLGVGTLLLKPRRHVTRVSELTASEASEQGPLIRLCATVVDELVAPEQTYVCLWSHAGGVPVHIHHVIMPATREQIERHGARGPDLQTAMFALGELPDPAAVEVFADRARVAVAGRGTPLAP